MRRTKATILMLFWSLSVLIPAERLFSFDLILKKEAPITGAFVCIGDLARVIAAPAEKKDAQKIQNICIMETPDSPLVISSQTIYEELILRSGYGTAKPDRILGKSVQILPQLRSLSVAEIEEKVIECYREVRGYDSMKYRFFIVDQDRLARDPSEKPASVVMEIPEQAVYTLECRSRNLMPGKKSALLVLENPSGHNDMVTSTDHRGIRNGKTLQSKKEIAYLVGIRQESYVALREIPQGRRIAKEDIEINVTYSLEKQSYRVVPSPLGMQSTRTIEPGHSLGRGDVERVIDVVSGSVVELEYLSGPFSIRLPARAMESVSVGEYAVFRLIKSNRRVRARVVSPTRAVLLEGVL